MLTLTDAERDALALLGHFFLKQQQFERALTVFAGLEVLEPERIEHARCAAVAALSAGRPERALVALDRIALSGRIDPTFHLVRAQALGGLDRQDEAAAAMRAWVDSNPAAPAPAATAGAPQERAA